MADVFISYHEKSAGELAAQIAAALESAGISCWYAKRNLKNYSGSFAGAITREIRACRVFLLVLSNESNQSEHVINEVSLGFQRIRAHEAMKPVYFKVDNCVLSDDMSYYLSRFQITDGNPPDKRRIQSLVEQIAVLVSQHPNEDSGQSLIITDKKRPRLSVVRQPLLKKAVPAFQKVLSVITPVVKTKLESVQEIELKPHQKATPKVIGFDIEDGKISYTVYENGLLTIFTGENCPIPEHYYNKIAPKLYASIDNVWWYIHSTSWTGPTELCIKEGITSIGDWAFAACESLTSVVIPKSVVSIGEFAFSNCVHLTNLTIPEGVVSIGGWAFDSCVKLSSVKIPDSVTSIGQWAFAGCPLLTSVSLSAYTKIAENTFHSTTAIIRR